MILRDIARARENIQKSLAGVSTALTPGGLSGISPSMAFGAPWGEACRAAHRTACGLAELLVTRRCPPCGGCSCHPRPAAACVLTPALLPPPLSAEAVPGGVGHGAVMVIQALSHVQLFATLWTAARQASLSFTISRSLLKLMSVESVMPSNHLILYRPLLPPSVFPSVKLSQGVKLPS